MLRGGEITAITDDRGDTLSSKIPRPNLRKHGGFFKSTEYSAYAGVHLLVEFWGAKGLDDEDLIRSSLMRAIEVSGCQLLGLQTHKFQPQGVTAVALLAESHVSLHSWPEHDFLALDIFTCGASNQAYDLLRSLETDLSPSRVEVEEVLRGKRNE